MPHPAPAFASLLGTSLHTGALVSIPAPTRVQGLYLLGVNGTGKSTLIQNLMLADINQGLGVCLIEPHGDLTRAVLASISQHRLKDVILLDLMDSEYPPGLNIFECQNPKDPLEVAKTANFVIHIFERLWEIGPQTPRLAQVLRSSVQVLLENPGTTFAEIPLLFWNEEVRKRLVSRVQNPQARLFWERYEQKNRREKEEFVESTDNKVSAYLSNDVLSRIVSQTRSTINFRRVLDEGKILLVLLSPQLEEISRLVGAMLIAKLLMAAYSRIDTPESERAQFHLYCDEFQRFATEDFLTFINESRKFRVGMTLSHQTLSQLPESLRSAGTSVAQIVAFRLSGEDAEVFSRAYDTTPTREIIGEEPIRAPVGEVIDHLVRRGHQNPRVTAFAQSALSSLEHFMGNLNYTTVSNLFGRYYLHPDNFLFAVSEPDIYKGRELLNEALYRCMRLGTSRVVLPVLALYILALAQRNGSHRHLDGHAQFKVAFNGPTCLQGFSKEAEGFGHPEVVRPDFQDKYLSSLPKRQRGAAAVLLKLLTELRATMDALSQAPILVDTGQYQPKYEQRPFADMRNEIVRDLTQQPNYQARVRLLGGEALIHTRPAPEGVTGEALEKRIAQIKLQMVFPTVAHCRYYKQVEREVRERQERLARASSHPSPSRSGAANRAAHVTKRSDDPPPTRG